MVGIRNALVVAAIVILFAWYNLLVAALRLLSPGRAADITERFVGRSVRQIFAIMEFYCGLRLTIENSSDAELPERFLLVSNHQSLVDIPVFMALLTERNLRFVAKKELGDGIPWVSMILRSQGHALVKRKGSAAAAMRSIVRFARRCDLEGTCPVIFPEGTRTRDGEVGAFHTAGVRKILAETPLPMVVAVLEGGWRIAKLKDVIANLGEASYRVRILSVWPAMSEKQSVLAALERARSDIISALAEMRRE